MFQEIYVVGGHMRRNSSEKGNIFTIPTNQYAEMNMFLDPLAAKTVLECGSCNITLIPLGVQRTATSFPSILGQFHGTQHKTPEAVFAKRLLSRLHRLKQNHHRYHHMVTHSLFLSIHMLLLLLAFLYNNYN